MDIAFVGAREGDGRGGNRCDCPAERGSQQLLSVRSPVVGLNARKRELCVSIVPARSQGTFAVPDC